MRYGHKHKRRRFWECLATRFRLHIPALQSCAPAKPGIYPRLFLFSAGQSVLSLCGYSSSWVSASAAGVNPGGSGSNGVILLPPDYVFSTIGGTGGAGNGTGTGGNGGNGAIGSGGGGGGAGVTGGTAGGGGNGYCLIIAY